MPDRISKLSMTGFRGASSNTTLNFSSRKPITLIFGENGSGKSCIVDAIDLIANDSPGSLGERSSTSIKSHLPTIGMKPADLSVQLTCGSKTWNGSLSGNKPKIQGPDPRPKVHVLRRSQLLTLIEAQPAKRYEELRRFIDVAGVEKSEQALRDASTTLHNEMDRSERDITDAAVALDELWNKEGAEGKNSREWAKSKVATDQTTLQLLAKELKNIIGLLDALKLSGDNLAEAEQACATKEVALKAVEKEIAESPGPNAADTLELISVLETAQSYIAAPRDVNECPVCEQTVVASNLRASIATRLTKMTEFRALSKRRKTADEELRLAQAEVNSAKSNFVNATASVGKSWKTNQATPIKNIEIQWNEFANVINETGAIADRTEAAKSFAKIIIKHHESLTNAHEDAQTDLARFNAIKGYYDRIVGNKEKTRELKILSGRMDKALKILHAERIKYTQGILDEVADECNRLYRILHPAELLGDSTLKLDTKRKGSLHQEAAFEGHTGVPPQAYFSDSHLDTLGLCVWLAIAKRENPKATIIVLDDVFTSVDAQHMSRIVQLLSDESKSFGQIIITTHYRNWRDRYRLAQGSGMSVQLLELHRWTLLRGIVASPTKLAVDELEAKIKSAPLDRQAVSSQAGILLEALLDQLALQYRCCVAHTPDGDLTLGELLQGCNSLFKKLAVARNGDDSGTTDASTTPTLKDLLDKINELGFIRNQVGCHFNIAGGDIADVDVEEFGLRTVALGRALTCLACGDIPNRRKGTHFECSCGKAKMTPRVK